MQQCWGLQPWTFCTPGRHSTNCILAQDPLRGHSPGLKQFILHSHRLPSSFLLIECSDELRRTAGSLLPPSLCVCYSLILRAPAYYLLYPSHAQIRAACSGGCLGCIPHGCEVPMWLCVTHQSLGSGFTRAALLQQNEFEISPFQNSCLGHPLLLGAGEPRAQRALRFIPSQSHTPSSLLVLLSQKHIS